jgi:hypothetical protein
VANADPIISRILHFEPSVHKKKYIDFAGKKISLEYKAHKAVSSPKKLSDKEYKKEIT